MHACVHTDTDIHTHKSMPNLLQLRHDHGGSSIWKQRCQVLAMVSRFYEVAKPRGVKSFLSSLTVQVWQTARSSAASRAGGAVLLWSMAQEAREVWGSKDAEDPDGAPCAFSPQTRTLHLS